MVITATDSVKMAKKQQVKTATTRDNLYIHDLNFFRNYYIAMYAFVVCTDYYSVCYVYYYQFKHISHTDDFPLNGYQANV